MLYHRVTLYINQKFLPTEILTTSNAFSNCSILAGGRLSKSNLKMP